MTDTPVRCVRVIARLNVGGPAQHAILLTEHLAATYPTLLVTGTVAAGEADMLPLARERGLRMFVIPELGREIRLLSDIRVFWKLFLLFRRVRPTIVHTHTAKAGTVGRLAAIAARVPVRVHTFHGHVFRGYFGRFKTGVFLRIERMLARFTDTIIAISDTQAEELSQRYAICERERIQVIPLGLQLERFGHSDDVQLRAEFRRSLGVTDESVICIVGRLVPIKNHDLFLEAAARVLRCGRRCVFVIAGGGTEEVRLRQRAAALGIAANVRFLGWRTDLERIYAGSDVVALTSDNEGTPVAVIEAMAAGRSIVATDVGGVSDVLENGRFGRIVAPSDPDQFAAAIIALLDDSKLRGGLAEAARASALARYGLPRLVSDITRLYDRLTSVRQKLPISVTAARQQV